MDTLLAILRAVLFVLIAYSVVMVAALVNILFERRALAFMQDRLGPNRTGPQGMLQSVADAFKMMGKEDFRPAFSDPVLFTLAPIMVMFGAVAVQLVIPYTNGVTAVGLDVGLFYIVAIAEMNRGPFDLPEAESELVAGYVTEYSGMRFGMFYLNEYAGLTIMSMIVVTLFFGGWQGPFANAITFWGVSWIGIIWFLIKANILVFVLIWIRLSLPRLQVDQLMGFAWKVLIPLGLVNILATAAVMLWVPHWKWGMAVFSWIAFFAFVGLLDPILKWRLRRQRDRLPVVNA